MLLEMNAVKFATFSKCLDIICDKGYTPYIGVDSTNTEYQGPYTQEDLVLLSLSGAAVRNFYMDEEGLSFGYSEGGVKATANVPMEAIVSIYAKEDVTMLQAFPIKKGVDTKPEGVQNAPTKVAGAKPIKKGFTPKLIQGGKK
jgi:stringent starvation protein B